MRLFVLATLAIASFSSFAATEGTIEITSPRPEFKPAEHTHFISSGIRIANYFSGLTLGYSYRVNPHWLVGIGGSMGNQNESIEGGSLDTAQYYKDEFTFDTQMAEVNSTFYFRENGYARWGFSMRGGVGHGWHRAEGKWGRYDRDPGWITIGGDRRLREEGLEKKVWGSTYARLGGYYQFLWGFKDGDRVGHVLELGLETFYFDRAGKVSYTKPNGDEESYDIASTTAAFQIQYSVAF